MAKGAKAAKTDEAETRMMSGVRKLASNGWAAGGTPWIFDVIAPFGGHEKAIQGVIDSVFSDRAVKIFASINII